MATTLNNSKTGTPVVNHPILKQVNDELSKEIERLAADRNFFGSVSVTINFQAGNPKFAKLDNSRTILS